MCVCASRPDPYHKTTTAGTFLNVYFAKRFLAGLNEGAFHDVHSLHALLFGSGKNLTRQFSVQKQHDREHERTSISTLQPRQREKNRINEHDAIVTFYFPFFMFSSHLIQKLPITQKIQNFKITDYRLRKYVTGKFYPQNYQLLIRQELFW